MSRTIFINHMYAPKIFPLFLQAVSSPYQEQVRRAIARTGQTGLTVYRRAFTETR